MTKPRKVTLVATDDAGRRHWGPEAVAYELDLLDPYIETHDDIYKSIAAAAREFAETDAGRKWVKDHAVIDFIALPHIPESITVNHGFKVARQLDAITWWPLANDLAAK